MSAHKIHFSFQKLQSWWTKSKIGNTHEILPQYPSSVWLSYPLQEPAPVHQPRSSQNLARQQKLWETYWTCSDRTARQQRNRWSSRCRGRHCREPAWWCCCWSYWLQGASRWAAHRTQPEEAKGRPSFKMQITWNKQPSTYYKTVRYIVRISS